MKIYRDLLILVGIFGLIWISVSLYFYNDEVENPTVLNASQKKSLADYLDQQFKNEQVVYHHQRVDSAVQVIMDRLEENTNHSTVYQITILDSEETNAFATLDGRIYIFTGLLKKCANPEMLAAVMAHEMGHIEHEHLVERLVNEVGFSLLLAILTGGDPVMVSELGKTAVSMHFNREQEREADEFGRSLLLKSNIDPIRFAQFMMIIKREEQVLPSLSFFNTHPEIEERILSTTQFSTPDGFQELAFEMNWEDILEALNEEK